MLISPHAPFQINRVHGRPERRKRVREAEVGAVCGRPLLTRLDNEQLREGAHDRASQAARARRHEGNTQGVQGSVRARGDGGWQRATHNEAECREESSAPLRHGGASGRRRRDSGTGSEATGTDTIKDGAADAAVAAVGPEV